MFFPKAASAFLTASVLLFGSPAWTDESQTYKDYLNNFISSYCQNEYDNQTDIYDDIYECELVSGSVIVGMLIENCRITGKSASYDLCYEYVYEILENHTFYLDDFTNAYTLIEQIDFIANVVRNNKWLLHQWLQQRHRHPSVPQHSDTTDSGASTVTLATFPVSIATATKLALLPPRSLSEGFSKI